MTIVVIPFYLWLWKKMSSLLCQKTKMEKLFLQTLIKSIGEWSIDMFFKHIFVHFIKNYVFKTLINDKCIILKTTEENNGCFEQCRCI